MKTKITGIALISIFNAMYFQNIPKAHAKSIPCSSINPFFDTEKPIGTFDDILNEDEFAFLKGKYRYIFIY